MRRGGVGAVGAVAALGLLSGCSPARLPLVAVSMGRDGKPVAMVRLCDGDHATGMALLSWDEDEDEDEHGDEDDAGADESAAAPSSAEDSGWVMWTPARIGPTTFRLFSPPASWHAETEGRQELLPGRTYALTFTGPAATGPRTTAMCISPRTISTP